MFQKGTKFVYYSKATCLLEAKSYTVSLAWEMRKQQANICSDKRKF